MPRPIELSDADYLAIEAKLSGDARGRAFLRRRDRHSRRLAIDKVRRLTRSVRVRLAGDEDGAGDGFSIRILRRHLHEMSACIRQTRREVAMLRAPEGARPRITRATGDLDAIVGATERATSAILGGTERIAALVAELPEGTAAIGAAIAAQTTEILTACSFHDITGQRLTKVINTLRYLETRMNAMLAIWGGAADEAETAAAAAEPDLPSGPSDDGATQADIDKLFA